MTAKPTASGTAGPRLGAAALWLALCLAGCAAAPPPRDDGLAACRGLFQELDAKITTAGVRDEGPYPVPGFPYLRSTRLLASFRDEVGAPARFAAWAGHMAQLDATARTLELRNLGHDDDALAAELARCRDRLLRDDLAAAGRRTQLRNAVVVPDDYLFALRVAGLYPLTAPLVSLGVAAWHRDTRATFAVPLEELPVSGTLQRWAVARGPLLGADEVRTVLRDSRDPLGLPQPDAAAARRLFDTFAPVWEVDVADDDDRIGLPQRDGPTADTTRPTEFRLLSHTRLGAWGLLQLNYLVWFPARPGDDIYAGRLDGLHWRVTLGPDGEPWLYDAIHPCGCYHLHFPTRHLRLRTDLPYFYYETPLLPQAAPEEQPLVLRIAHRTHFIQRVYPAGRDDKQPAAPLAWEDYDLLRALPEAGGHRSLFGAHGIVAGSERPERWILWPMGIRSPGAMRQWGRHAVAFVGRRHFDDPRLIEALFEQQP